MTTSILKKAFITVCAVGLVGCASGPTAYQSAGSSSELGFSETKIQNDRFRVSFLANSEKEASDFALLRAAEIAKAEGYSHFEILKVNNSDLRQSGPRPSVGLGRVGLGGVGPSIGLGRVNLGGNKSKTRQNLEVKLLNNVQSSADIYAADEVIKNITP